jgi:hypothetical protein
MQPIPKHRGDRKMAKKRILVIVIVIIALLLMTTPVSAIVKPPTTIKDSLLKGIWSAIIDLQNQITALTQRVDAIQTSPIPEYRAGSYTTPSDEYFFHHTVTFSKPMPNTNYRVFITNADNSKMSRGSCPECILTIDSKTLTGFTFSYHDTNYDSSYGYFVLEFNHKFDYIAVADK